MLQNVAILHSVCLLCSFILITWTDQIREDIQKESKEILKGHRYKSNAYRRVWKNTERSVAHPSGNVNG